MGIGCFVVFYPKNKAFTLGLLGIHNASKPGVYQQYQCLCVLFFQPPKSALGFSRRNKPLALGPAGRMHKAFRPYVTWPLAIGIRL